MITIINALQIAIAFKANEYTLVNMTSSTDNSGYSYI